MPFLTQRRWRTIGGVALGLSALMGLYGPRVDPRDSVAVFAVYWGVFIFLLLIILWAVLLDVRYIRVQYSVGKREIFRDTLGDEEFRRALLDAHRKSPGRPPKDDRGNG